MPQAASPIFRPMEDTAYSTFLKNVGRKIGEVRRSRGLSQERAAHLLDMDRVSIGYIEQGRRSPKLLTLYRLAALYDVQVTEFFAFEETPNEAFERLFGEDDA